MNERAILVDDYLAAQQYAAAFNAYASPDLQRKNSNAWTRGDWPVAIPILAYWAFLAVFGFYDWWLMLVAYASPPGYLIIPVVRLVLFGGPAVLAFIYHPSAFKVTAWYFGLVVGNLLTESDPYSVWHYVNLCGSLGVLMAGWLSNRRIRQHQQTLQPDGDRRG